MARTTALNKIEAAILEPTFYKVIQGGMSGGKTFAIVTCLIGYAESFPNSLITIVGLSYPQLKGGSIRDFQNIMRQQNRWDESMWNKTESTYRFPNGSLIEFKSVDKMTAHGMRRDVLFVNEANGISWDTFDQLASRTKDFCIVDYNPSAKFWAHEQLVDGRFSKDTTFLILTYKDNEALSAREIENIEIHAPKPGEEPSNWWVVYGLGQIGSLEGNVYSGWVESSLSEIPNNCRLVRYGLDFGFSNDETALVAIYEVDDGSQTNERQLPLYIEEIIYQKGMLGSQYAVIFDNHAVQKDVLIVADSARPEIIAEIRAAGFRIIGADKNAGSVKRGIDNVMARQIYYSGQNLKREYLSYAWRKKRTGEVLDEPQDGNDHCLAGEVLVNTLKGQIPIRELVGKKGWVWCEEGKLRRFRNVRQTSVEPILRLEFSDGQVLRCSPEHPVYTITRGIVPAYLLTDKDIIQMEDYGKSRGGKREKTKIQWKKLLERRKKRVLSQCSSCSSFSSQTGVDILPWPNTGRLSHRPYRPRQEQQPNRKFTLNHSEHEQQKCVRGNQKAAKRELGQNPTISEEMARFGRGSKMAFRAWQNCILQEKSCRKDMCALWEKILYNTIMRKGSFLLKQLQNARTKKTAQRSSGKCSTLRLVKVSRQAPEPVYCMDVYDTSNFSVEGGIIVSNCMDALRYAVDDLSKKPVSYGSVRL